jgi:hypothetical protein
MPRGIFFIVGYLAPDQKPGQQAVSVHHILDVAIDLRYAVDWKF